MGQRLESALLLLERGMYRMGKADGASLRAVFVRVIGAVALAAGSIGLFGGSASAALPDGRAYELVTPIAKHGENVLTDFNPTAVITASPFNAYFASADGQHALFGLVAGPETANGISGAYVATRTAAGWTATPISPPPGVEHPDLVPSDLGVASFGDAAGGDLSRPLFAVFGVLDPAAGGDLTDIYERNPDGSFTWLSHGSLGGTAQNGAAYAGRSADGKHVLFISTAILESQAGALSAGLPEVYDRFNNETRVVAILPPSACPSATPCVNPNGAKLGDGYAQPNGTHYSGFGGGTPAVSSEHAVSSDGSRIFFESPAIGSTEVYVRQDGMATTEISLSRKTGAVGTPASTAEFQQASADGSKVFFSSPDELTTDATTNGGLYEYDVNTGALTFVTPDSVDAGGSGFLGVIAAANGGTRIYFLAEGKLVAGQGVSGQSNLYLYDGSGVKFVTTLSPEDQGGLLRKSAFAGPGEVRATPDGRYLVFQSNARVTSYDNHGFHEIYRYDAATEQITCVSCDHTRVPTADAALYQSGLPSASARIWPSQYSLPRNISEDGSMVFFDTAEPLVPQASNGRVNVYEWHDGQVALISDGSGPDDAHFFDASADGKDAFFTTFDRLVANDGDNNRDLYDARIGGGFPAAPVAPQCEAEGCHAVSYQAPAQPRPFSELLPGTQSVMSAISDPPAHPQASHHRKKRRHHRAKKRRRARIGNRAKTVMLGQRWR
jgi:hypothetical protein